jgi:ribosomal protein L32
VAPSRKTDQARRLIARRRVAFARAAVTRCPNCGQIEIELPALTTQELRRHKDG